MSVKGFRAIMKNKKALQEVMALGKQYDNEQDPEKKEALKKEIEQRCAALKGKLTTEHAAIVAEGATDSASSDQNCAEPE